MNRYRRASGNGSPGNNGFASHSMQPDAEGHLLLTDYEGKKIRVLDPALVNDDLANDASIDLDDLSLSPGFKPKTLALCGDRWYATGDNGAGAQPSSASIACTRISMFCAHAPVAIGS